MTNILQFATNKQLVISYFLEDGYMSDTCFFRAEIHVESAKNAGLEFLIQHGATRKNIGEFIELTTFYDSDGGYMDFYDVAEDEENMIYRVYIDKDGFFESWDLIE